jgi:hypothetical protein
MNANKIQNDNLVKQITDDRGSEYGDFTTQSRIAQELKDVMRNTPNWQKLDPVHREGLEMIAHKISRILNGNPNNEDSWVDIEGYANIVRKRLSLLSSFGIGITTIIRSDK